MTYHNITGGAHPWYVFKGSPILKVNKLKDHSSVVDYDLMPTPLNIAQAFHYLNQGTNYNRKLTRGESTLKALIFSHNVIAYLMCI